MGIAQDLRQGRFVSLVATAHLGSVMSTELAGLTGHQGAFIDMEHANLDFPTVALHTMAARAGGIECVVRVRKDGETSYARAFEAGASGILVPHIATAAEAREIVRLSRFPPLGGRSMAGGGADARYGLTPGLEHLRRANEEALVGLMIEDREGLENAETIAAVPGYDFVFIGITDLSLSLGLPFQFDHPDVEAAIARIGTACARHGKAWGLPAISAAAVQRRYRLGARFFTWGADIGILSAGYRDLKKAVDETRRALEG